jgi:Protein of unknown function (DUF3060)
MLRITGKILVICFGGAIACTNARTQPPLVQDGWLRYTTSRAKQTITCGEMPVQLEGNRTDLMLTGYCRFVRITGDRNDIHVQVTPAGTIEVVGNHNDIWWRQVGPGPRPRLLDNGSSNTFHWEES